MKGEFAELSKCLKLFVMNMIVCKIYFAFHVFLNNFNLLKTVIFWPEFTLSFYKNILTKLERYYTKFAPQ